MTDHRKYTTFSIKTCLLLLVSITQPYQIDTQTITVTPKAARTEIVFAFYSNSLCVGFSRSLLVYLHVCVRYSQLYLHSPTEYKIPLHFFFFCQFRRDFIMQLHWLLFMEFAVYNQQVFLYDLYRFRTWIFATCASALQS